MFFKKLLFALRDYFTFTIRERRGSMWLLLIVTAQLGWLYYDKYLTEPEPIDLSDFNARIVDFTLKEPEQPSLKFVNKAKSEKPDSLFNFDPNTISLEQFKLLGLSEKQAASILRYREKGGKFRSSDDFSKMYAVSPEMFVRLKPYIVIEPSEKNTAITFQRYQPEKKTAISVELNSATIEEIDKLPMIGPSKAERIIKYREALGGFSRIGQLREVYGLDSTTFDTIAAFVTVDQNAIHKININNDSLRHPYLPYRLVKLIRAYRKEHGDFTHPEDIRRIPLFNEEIYLKIAPYLIAE